MNSAAVDTAQLKAARAAGAAYLIAFATVVAVNFGIHDRLIDSGNAAATVRNILAHEQLFRLGVLGDVIYCAATIVQLAALYVVLRPVSPGLALLGAVARLAWALVWLIVTLQLVSALQLVSSDAGGPGSAAGPLQGLAALYLGRRFDYYYIGLPFGALASTVCSYLWLKSRYIPWSLAAVGFATSLWCLVCAVVFIVLPSFADIVNLWWFDLPMGLFDIALSVWLLVKGLAPAARHP